MSAAVMSSSAVYDFGDTLLKSHSSSGAARHQHGHGVRWGEGRTALDYQRESLSRRVSSPAAPPGLSLNMAQTLVIQLDAQQQQQQQQLSPPAPATPTGPAVAASAPVTAHRKLDRSHSEPANPASACKAAAHAAAAAANINTSRYKTELCRPFEESGSCKYGDKCQFAHGGHELRTLVRHPKYKTELCRTYHTIGLCPYGPRCHFVHNDEEAQAAHAAHAAHAKQGAAAMPVPAMPMARPKALTLATAHSPAHSYLGSTADSPSPTSSLSQSPTNSRCSFFMSSEDVFGSVSPTPTSATANTAFSFAQDFAPLLQSPGPAPAVGHHVPCGSTGSSGSSGSGSSRDSPSPPGSPFRLPIFNSIANTISQQVMNIRLDV